MKLSELREAVDRAIRSAGGEDLDVVIRTQNPSCPARGAVELKMAGRGSDWDAWRFLLFPAEGLVYYRRHSGTAMGFARMRLEQIKAGQAALGFKYIPKSRESEWLDGFCEGMASFAVCIGDDGVVEGVPTAVSTEELK
jgi:hypothetical protein